MTDPPAAIQKLLIIGYVWPEPASSAAGSRMLELIRCFADAGWQITFACAATDSEHRADLSPWGVSQVAITLNCDSFNVLVAQWQPDVVLFDRFVTEEQYGWRVAQHCPGALRVIDTEDLHSLRRAREILLDNARRQCPDIPAQYRLGPVSADSGQLWDVMAEDESTLREIAALYRSDLNLIISGVEMQLLQQAFAVPESLLHWTPFMRDTHSRRPALDYRQRQHFIALGNFRHPPNRDSVLWLKHQLWPMIRALLPEAELQVYGAYPDKAMHSLHNPKQGFYVRGRADSAQAVMGQARVCLAPLRFGAGLKGKLLDAMECGTPSVTTAIGAEGMHGELPWGGAVADTAEAFAEQAVALYSGPALWQQAQQSGYRILAVQFDYATLAPPLIERLKSLHSNLAQHRRQNFTGSMLRQHLHRSTEYMSRWIDAKQQLAGRPTE